MAGRNLQPPRQIGQLRPLGGRPPARLRPHRPRRTLDRPDRAARPGPPLGRRAAVLHNDAYPADDRAAGLLVLLYAQKLTAITALTTQHVQPENGRTLLRLGSLPILLPAPLDDLVAGLQPTAGDQAAACSRSHRHGCSQAGTRAQR